MRASVPILPRSSASRGSGHNLQRVTGRRHSCAPTAVPVPVQDRLGPFSSLCLCSIQEDQHGLPRPAVQPPSPQSERPDHHLRAESSREKIKADMGRRCPYFQNYTSAISRRMAHGPRAPLRSRTLFPARARCRLGNLPKVLAGTEGLDPSGQCVSIPLASSTTFSQFERSACQLWFRSLVGFWPEASLAKYQGASV